MPDLRQSVADGSRRAWDATRGAAVRSGHAVAMGWRRASTPGVALEPLRLEAAMRATRPWVFVQTLALFVAGLSVDDLGVLRVPGYVIAAGGALLVFSVGSVVQARGLALRGLDLDGDAFQVRMRTVERVGLLALVFTVLGAVGWFVVFSSGVPPWAS